MNPIDMKVRAGIYDDYPGMCSGPHAYKHFISSC